MNLVAEPQLLDLDALTRELLLTPQPTAERSADENQSASVAKRTRKRNAPREASRSANISQPQVQTSPIEAPKTLRTSTSSVELTELLRALTEAFDHIVGPIAQSNDDSLKGRIIFRMKRRFVLCAAEQFVQTCVCATIEDVVDELLNEAFRINLISK